MHPEEFTDTDPRAMEVWLELLRQKAPGERVAVVLGLAELALQYGEVGVRRMYLGRQRPGSFASRGRAASAARTHDSCIRLGSRK